MAILAKLTAAREAMNTFRDRLVDDPERKKAEADPRAAEKAFYDFGRGD